jgi:hypothetical protein
MFLFADEKMLPIAFRAEKRAGIPVKVEWIIARCRFDRAAAKRTHCWRFKRTTENELENVASVTFIFEVERQCCLLDEDLGVF